MLFRSPPLPPCPATDTSSLNFPFLSLTNILILSKKSDAERITDYKPISLIRSFSNIFSKMLASRLAPSLAEIVSPSQSAFIKKWRIHDNFLHVQGLIKDMGKEKTPGFFLKLDIAKAFVGSAGLIYWSFWSGSVLVHVGGGESASYFLQPPQRCSSTASLARPSITPEGYGKEIHLSYALHHCNRPTTPPVPASFGGGYLAALSCTSYALHCVPLC